MICWVRIHIWCLSDWMPAEVTVSRGVSASHMHTDYRQEQKKRSLACMDGEHFAFFTIFSSWSAWSVYDRTAQMCGKWTPWENRIVSQRCVSELQTCWAVSSRCWSNHSNWQQQRSPQDADSCVCIKMSVNKPPYNRWAVYAGGKSSVITLPMWLVFLDSNQLQTAQNMQMYLWHSKPGCLTPWKWSLEGLLQLADFPIA